MKTKTKERIKNLLKPNLETTDWIFVFLVIIGISAGFLGGVYSQDVYDMLSKKNGTLDTITPFVFLTGGIIGFVNIIRLPSRREARSHLAIPLIGIFCFLEEISYGSNWLNLRNFKIFGVTLDSFHDFLSVFYKILGTYLLLIIAILLYFLLRRTHKRIRGFLAYPAYKFVLIGFIFLFCSAVLFDLNVVYFPPLEEVYETLAGLSILVAALKISGSSSSVKSESRTGDTKIR